MSRNSRWFWLLVGALPVVAVACGASENSSLGEPAAQGGAQAQGAAASKGGAGQVQGGAASHLPPSTVVDPDTYATSCEQEKCTATEKCLQSASGSSCAVACEGQLVCSEKAQLSFCDRQGGLVGCAAP